ncbi:MAG: hypothetical protein WC449_04720 [Candidatus Paceibacterota bacterium]
MEDWQKTIWQNTKKRGVIPSIPLSTLNFKFFDKLQEEVNELISAYYEHGYIDPLELADVFIVVSNCASANDIDILEYALSKSSNDLTRKKSVV